MTIQTELTEIMNLFEIQKILVDVIEQGQFKSSDTKGFRQSMS